MRVSPPSEPQRRTTRRAPSGPSARLVAGFCWPWSDPNSDGTLVEDVRIGEWSMPWNARPEASGLAPGIPKSHYWATDPGGLGQVGCIYTAQGFEFDFVGVIFGRDLVHRLRDGWVSQPEFSKDPAIRRGVKASPQALTDLLRQTYRVLLTRGLKGCYVCFEDPPARDFFLSRVEQRVPRSAAVAEESVEVEKPT